jgi:hypothetical protein
MGNRTDSVAVASAKRTREDEMGRGLLMWLVGIPLPIIIIWFLFFRH